MRNADHRRRTWIAGAARLAATVPFFVLGATAMSVSVAARGALVGALIGGLLAGIAAGAVPGPLPGFGYLAIAVLVGTMAFLGFVSKARRTLRTRLRLSPAILLLGARSPGTEAERGATERLARLARQVDVPTPTVRVVRTDRPVCFTLAYPDGRPPAKLVEETLGVELARTTGADRDGVLGGPTASAFADGVDADEVVVVSTGLLDRLSTAELEAVLAHELAHLRNDDLRLMNWLLTPVAWAESAVAATTHSAGNGRTLVSVGRNLSKLATLGLTLPGVAVFNRGREFAADRGGVAITGDPASLASALESLDGDARSSPVADLRSVAVVNVVGSPAGGVPFAHPPIDRRIERLRRMTAETATGNR